MSIGLSVSRLIAVSLSLTSAGAQFANLDTLLILGQSDVIDTQTRIVEFDTLPAVATAFGTSAPEYLAASEFFSQTPTPTICYIGRWAQAATSGRLFGAILTATQQALANFTAVASGGFHITVDGGAAVNVATINLSGASNLNGVATLINTAMTSASVAATCSWTGSQFVFKSNSTGTASKVVALTAPSAGTDISGLLGCNAAASPREVDGIAAESLITAVTLIDQLPTFWYALNDDACTSAVSADRQAVAAYIEGASTTSVPHMYGFTSQDTNAVVSSATTDIGFILNALGYKRTFVWYSSMSKYAAAGIFGDLLTVNFQGSNTMETMAWKQIVGVVAELLTGAQASALDAKGYNYFATFNNGVAITVNGWMVCSSKLANQVFIDEIFGADALANQIQVNYFNLLVANPKVPQTDSGSHLGANAIEAALITFVANGYLAAGTWNAAGFGQLAQGDLLPRGYYIYTPPIATQAQNIRATRQSVPYQVAAKTAGAIQSANILLNVNP